MRKLADIASFAISTALILQAPPALALPCWMTGDCPLTPRPVKLPCWSTGECPIIPDTGDLNELWLDIRNTALNPPTQAAFAATFASAYTSLANFVNSRNPQWEFLANEQKELLRPFVGNLVDSAKIHYESVLPDNIKVLRKDLKLMEGSAAQTYCDHIYIAGPNKGMAPAHVRLIHHELVHYDQCIRKGGLERFGYDYGLGLIRANFIYENNDLEEEAYNKERMSVAALARPAPPTSDGSYIPTPPGPNTPAQTPKAVSIPSPTPAVNTVVIPSITGYITPSTSPNICNAPFVAPNSYGGWNMIANTGYIVCFTALNNQTRLYDSFSVINGVGYQIK